MDNQLSETQELLRRTAADFFAKEYPLERMREMYAAPTGYDGALWKAISGLGWNSAPFPEEVGGFEGSFLEASVLLEELGRACCASPFNHSTIAAGLTLAANRELAAAIANGEAVVIPVPGGSLIISGGTATGTLAPVPFADIASHILVSTASGVALAEMGQTAVKVSPIASIGLDPCFEVSLDGAALAELGDAGSPALVANLGAAANALMLLGTSQTALDLAVVYARERIQFGKPIGSFQAIQHKCADMAINIEIGRNLAYKAAWEHTNGEPFERTAAYAKSWLGDTAGFVTRQALQIHGGVGFVDNHRAQLPYRMATELTLAYGAPHEQRRQISDALLGD